MIDALTTFTHNLLSYGRNTHAILAAAEAAPHDATLNTYAAAAAMFGMTPAARLAATPYLSRASQTAQAPDERLLLGAMRAWQDGDEARAVALHRERFRIRPDDLAALKICQLHYINLGDFDGMLTTLRELAPYHADNHFVLGQLAFALEETGHTAEAFDMAARAVAAAQAAGSDDPWSIHALMHAHHRAGELRDSIDLVHRHEGLWARSGTFMGIHAWWHAAIAELDLDQIPSALAIYDEHLAPVDPECVQSLVARVSLLARLRLRGVDVGARWAPLLDTLMERADDGVNGFLDVHYVYGLAIAGQNQLARSAAEKLDGLASQAALALIAEADGDAGQAAQMLEALTASLHHLGGSHEQRELYELVETKAAIEHGQLAQAEMILSEGSATRPPWQRHLLQSLRDGDAAVRLSMNGSGCSETLVDATNVSFSARRAVSNALDHRSTPSPS
jgi:tetratricopeptide (TPR) repeat protein